MRIDNHGEYMYEIIKKLFPICRSITGEGFRKSLKILSNELPLLKIKKFPSGSKAFDWEIPQEWIIRDAYVLDPEGKKIIDFKSNNLHLVGYSSKISKKMSLDELKVNLKDKKSLLEDLRFQKALQQLENPLQIRLIRKEIAQIKTLINEYISNKKKIEDN